jgi:hypothetical protein
MIVILFSTLSVSGDVESVTKSFTLRSFDVTFTFPKTVKPGDPVTVSVNAVAKSSVRLVDVSIQVLAFTEGGDLQSIGSASLVSNQYVSSGERLTKDLTVTVPANAPRSELTAVFSQTTASSYSYYSYYYPSYYYYGHYSYYWYYPYYYSYYYPQTPSEQYVESKVLPCSYVLATTPEEAKLKADYDSLNTQYNDLSARYQQATEQNRQLSEKYAQATQDASNSKIMAYTFLGATVILAVLAAFLALHRHQKPAAQTGSSSGASTTESSETKK